LFFRLYRLSQEGRSIFLEVYTPCCISTVEKRIESGAGETGKGMKRQRCVHEVKCTKIHIRCNVWQPFGPEGAGYGGLYCTLLVVWCACEMGLLCFRE
jgi:hypothetical protein